MNIIIEIGINQVDFYKKRASLFDQEAFKQVDFYRSFECYLISCYQLRRT